MLCINPFRRPSYEHGCGQCLPCRINRRRTWTSRICLEALAYPYSSFVTLTYSEEHLPAHNSLSDSHWREFTKNIGFRYFGCGEYGDHHHRPHYHIILFGLDAQAAEAFVLARWPYGFVCVRPFVFEHASYTAAYTVKKLNKLDDPRLSVGQRPEFARMSRRPAIGWYGMGPFSRWLLTPEGVTTMSETFDVPKQVRINGCVYPLGSTLVRKLRDAVGVLHDSPIRHEFNRARYRAQNSLPREKRLKEGYRQAHYDILVARNKRKRGHL